jgi:AraC-like DNA-binding protein
LYHYPASFAWKHLAREETASYLSLNEIAKCLGCGVKILRKHCPDLCHAIVNRNKHQRTEDNARTLMKQALESALAGSEPVPLIAVAQQIGCAPRTLHRYFPDLCQAVVMRYRRRFDYEQVRQRLQEVLNSNEEVPPVSELAKQIGYGAKMIWGNFSDLCKQISARYRAQQQKQHEERMAAICEQIRQVMLILHRQGIYPGARQVYEQLNNRHILRTIEGHEAWRLMLEELGYPTDKLKRYD